MSLPELAEKAVCAANEAVYSRAQRNQRLNGMGTTLVALVVEERRGGCSTWATAGSTGCAAAGWSKSPWTTRWWRSRSGWAA